MEINGFINIIVLEVDSISSCLVDLTMLWHQWMGRMGEKGLCAIHSKGMVEVIFYCSLEVKFYGHYIYGKLG